MLGSWFDLMRGQARRLGMARETFIEEPRNDEPSQAEKAARVIERAIIEGELRPKERLGVHQLAARYSIGATPIREGLSRLAHRGFVVALDNRGFRVADATESDLRDIIRVRMSIEVDALRLSMLQGDDAWEAGVLGAMHVLERSIVRTGTPDAAGIPDALHKAFHMSLIAACGSARMLDLCSLYFDQAYRYRRLLFGQTQLPAERFVAEHKKIARVALERRLKPAIQVYARHINRTLTSLYPESRALTLPSDSERD
jgi:GntR family carbon starvation induced transcriptional regulator